MKIQKRIYIAWINYSPVAHNTAYYLGANVYYIQYTKSMYLKLVHYILAFIKTLFVLQQNEPDVIFVQNPPIFSVLPVWIYCRFHKKNYVIDSHSGAFLYRTWARFLWLFRYLAKQALMNIQHNDEITNRVLEWKASAMTMAPLPLRLNSESVYPLNNGFNVAVISSFAPDEPVEQIINTANRIPSINFYMTGNLKNLKKEFLVNAPKNLIFTNFLKTDQYIALLKGCDVIMCLTSHSSTMLWGALEGLIIGRPIITSNQEVLKNYFIKGTICADNNAESLQNAIHQIKENYKHYQEEILTLRGLRIQEWENKFKKLLEILNQS